MVKRKRWWPAKEGDPVVWMVLDTAGEIEELAERAADIAQALRIARQYGIAVNEERDREFRDFRFTGPLPAFMELLQRLNKEGIGHGTVDVFSEAHLREIEDLRLPIHIETLYDK